VTAQKRQYDRTSYVLVVDDDNTLLKFFKIHLNKFFSRVIVVKNAKEAIDALKEKEIDLVITDIRMPRVDGFQLMKKVRSFNAAIPVLLISGGALTDEQLKECSEMSDGFVRKPFSVDELHDAINLGLDKREILKQLALLIPDNKNLLHFVSGKVKTPKVTEAGQKEQAEQLLGTLKSAG